MASCLLTQQLLCRELDKQVCCAFDLMNKESLKTKGYVKVIVLQGLRVRSISVADWSFCCYTHALAILSCYTQKFWNVFRPIVSHPFMTKLHLLQERQCFIRRFRN